jgi:hypothetical protein
VAIAVAALAVAITTAPRRALRSKPAKHGKPATTEHVQVHLADNGRVRDIERSCRAALNRAARTWAPFPLPLDRVEVLPSAPPLGKADIFEQWASTSTEREAATASLVVVSIGTTADGRERVPDEIAGALAVQIEKLVIDRYRREHSLPSAAPASQLANCHAAAPVTELPVQPARERDTDPGNVTDLSSVRALLADIKKSSRWHRLAPLRTGLSQRPIRPRKSVRRQGVCPFRVGRFGTILTPRLGCRPNRRSRKPCPGAG